jgi:hypothetical protein
VRRGAEQQMDMIGTHMPLQNLNVVRPTDLKDFMFTTISIRRTASDRAVVRVRTAASSRFDGSRVEETDDQDWILENGAWVYDDHHVVGEPRIISR